MEIKDIRDELTMIQKALTDQRTVLSTMANELGGLDTKLLPQVPDVTLREKLLCDVVDANIRDFKIMKDRADETYEGVCTINQPSAVLRANINNRLMASWNSSKNKSTHLKPALHGSWRKIQPYKER